MNKRQIQIQRLLRAHQCEALTWPHDRIAHYSPRHAAAVLGAELIQAIGRIEALEAAIRAHKAKHAAENYMACFDSNADLWGQVDDDAKT